VLSTKNRQYEKKAGKHRRENSSCGFTSLRVQLQLATLALLQDRGKRAVLSEQKEMAESPDFERLVAALCREIGQFEQKVIYLQEKCGCIRSCISELADKLRQCQRAFARSKEGIRAAGQEARAVVDRGQDLVDVLSSFISDFTETEKILCELVNDCSLTSRRSEQAGASMPG
jgi:chromosome segregation ATPase